MSALDPDQSIAKHLIVSDEAKDTRDFLDNDTFGLSTPEGRASYSLVDRSDLPLTLPPEVEEGNIEYKLKLVNPSQNRFEHLITQMKWRLDEGGGQAIYRLGVDDNGAVSGLTVTEMAASLSTIYRMARRLGASLSLLRECTVEHSSAQPSPTNQADALPFHRKAVELLVQRHLLVNQGLPDLCIAMLGSVDAGKSTLLGILTDGELDNGRGRARLNLFRHLHEVQTGRTSSLSSEVIGFDAAGRLINRQRSKGRLTRRTVDETGQFFPVLVVEIRRNRQPHKALYCGQMGSLALATEPIDKKDEKTAGTDGDFLLDSVRIRRGMVLLNRHPLCPDVPSIGLSGETVTTAAVSWSFSVSSIVWVPCATTCGKTCRSIPAVNSTVAVYSGSVCQHARVVDVTIDPKYWSKLISVSELETSVRV
nr:unnamed protein product [Spirometra erinaceieuropaei]